MSVGDWQAQNYISMDASIQNPNNRGLHSQALDLLRFPLAVIVVLMHIMPLLGEPYNPQNYPLFDGLLKFIMAFLRQQSVPIYFFISGYVFFLGVEFSKETYIRKLKNRVKTLLIPYLIWNTLAIISCFIGNSAALVRVPGLFSPNAHGILSAYWTYDGTLLATTAAPESVYPINIPLWFLRNLMIVVVCTPIIHLLIKRFKYLPVALLGCIWFMAVFFKALNPLSFCTSFFFFSWGAYMSINKKNMVSEFGRFFKSSMILYPCLGLACLLSAYIYPDAVPVIKHLNIVAGLLFAYNLAVWLLQKGYCRVNGFLASTSFFIYVSHWIMIEQINFVRYLLLRFILRISEPAYVWVQFVKSVLMLVLTIAVSLSVFWLMKRYAPGLLRVLTGRK